MEAIKKFFLMLWYRIKGKMPKFFIALQAIAGVMAAIGVAIMTIYPYVDFAVFVLHEGKEYQKIFYFSELLAGIGTGLSIGPAFVVENYNKYLFRLREKGVDVTKDKV